MDDVILSVRGVSKIFPRFMLRKKEGFFVFRKLSFELHRGECLGIIGPNGSGKTTLIKIIIGLIEPTEGIVNFAINSSSSAGYYKRKIGFASSEERSFFWRLSVYDNLDFFACLYHIPKKERASLIHYYLEYFDLIEYRNKLFMLLSSGMKQKLILIRALMHEPELLFLDEPLKNLDSLSKEKFLNIIQEKIKKKKLSIIFVSHEIMDHLRICNRIGLMQKDCLKIYESTLVKKVIENNEEIRVKIMNLPPKDVMKADIEVEQVKGVYELIISGSYKEIKLKELLSGLYESKIEVMGIEISPLRLETIVKLLNNTQCN